MRPLIRVENLLAAYEGEVVLDRLTFEVRKGEVFVILGGSGSGKSTLLKHMIGLHHPVSGRIRLMDRELTETRGEARRSLLQKIGVMYQNGALFGSMTLLENVRLPLEEFTRLSREAMDLVARMK
ncbi:MAG: ATP-binding cassette domain-containing protein, partial [Planctomycetes bacterium]|nr:ATP-binding cassette domain-containing protein [Planctomycetota bacterium]